MSKALFLDRDGTLILDKVYLADPAGVELIPGVAAGLQRARSLGYKLFLFTNQSGDCAPAPARPSAIPASC